MFTNSDARQGADAVGTADLRSLALAFWAWNGAAVLIGVASFNFGAALNAAAGATALALAPGFLGFLLLPKLSEDWARWALLAGWWVAALGLTAGTGGAFSPAAVLFLVSPLLGAAIGPQAPARLGAAALLGFALAALVAPNVGPYHLGPFAPLIAAAGLALAVLVLSHRPAGQDTLAAYGLPVARVKRNGAIVSVSPEAVRLFGLKPREGDLFAALWERLSAGDQRALERAVVSAAGGESSSALVRLGEHTLDIAAAPDVAGGALLSVRDVTANLRATSARVAAISHELRTPLTHILGFAEMMQAKVFGPIDARYVEYAGLIRTSGGHLLELVNSLLDLARIEAGRYELEPETFDMRDIVREVLRLSAGMAEPKSIALEERLPDQPLRVRADPRAMRQMLINTVGNAVKFTPQGGRVVVEARAEGSRLVIDTIDNGPGIPVGDRDRLGAPYERGASARNVQGSGLGLALIRAFAELHGGRLSFHDAPGGGALVRLDLPVIAP